MFYLYICAKFHLSADLTVIESCNGLGIDLWNSSQFAIGTHEYGSAVALW